MPSQAHSGISGDPWHHCTRCGLAYRLSKLAWQGGKLVCIVGPGNCFDSETARARDHRLAHVLDEVSLYPDAQLDSKLTNPQLVSEEE
jgi:hypothetical protein